MKKATQPQVTQMNYYKKNYIFVGRDMNYPI